MFGPSRAMRFLLMTTLLAGTVGCDQATKTLAITGLKGEPGHAWLGGLFKLTYAENSGAFLGMFGEASRPVQFWLLTAGVGLGLLALVLYLLLDRKLTTAQSVALALLTGGGIGNWIDRVWNDGRVVDFMILGIGSVRTGVFNVADVAIMVGLGIMVIFSQRMTPTDAVTSKA